MSDADDEELLRDFAVVKFPTGFCAVDEWEMERKGFVYAFLEFQDGRRYPVMFINPVRLQQDVEDTLKSGLNYYFEQGLVVVSDVTMSVIKSVLPSLIRNGFLEGRIADQA